MESILTSIKKLLGISEEYEQFDLDIITHVNSIMATLTQLGVGPKDGFFVTSKEQTWEDFMTDNPKLAFVKSYVYLKVKLLFDPPSSSAVIESINKQIGELEWRIFTEADLQES